MDVKVELDGEGIYGSLICIYNREEVVYDASVSPDGKYIAAVVGDGSLLFLDSETLALVHRNGLGSPYDDFPSTALRWLPHTSDGTYALISTSTAGGVFVWRWDGNVVERIVRIHEKDNEILCLALSDDGEGFLTAGSDRVVRYYGVDGTLKGVLSKGYDESGLLRATHMSRIFSVCFLSSTIVVSGGWESPIQVWDMRNFESRIQIKGTKIAADAIEPIHNTSCIIVTSNRSEQQLQVFDCVSGEELETESSRLSASMMNEIPLLSRYCKASGFLWTIVSKPHRVVVTLFLTGDLLGSCALPFLPINIRVSDHFPNKAFISCARGRIFVATVKL